MVIAGNWGSVWGEMELPFFIVGLLLVLLFSKHVHVFIDFLKEVSQLKNDQKSQTSLAHDCDPSTLEGQVRRIKFEPCLGNLVT